MRLPAGDGVSPEPRVRGIGSTVERPANKHRSLSPCDRFGFEGHHIDVGGLMGNPCRHGDRRGGVDAAPRARNLVSRQAERPGGTVSGAAVTLDRMLSAVLTHAVLVDQRYELLLVRVR